MRQTVSDLLAAFSIALLLGGVNDQNPYRLACVAAAALVGLVSYQIGRKL